MAGTQTFGIGLIGLGIGQTNDPQYLQSEMPRTR